MSPLRRLALLLLLLAMISLVRMEDELLEDMELQKEDADSEGSVKSETVIGRCTKMPPRPAGARCADGYAKWLPLKNGYLVPYSNVQVVYHISLEKCRQLCWANGRCESADFRAPDVNTLDGSCFLNNKGVEGAVYKSDDEHLITFECCEKDDCKQLGPRPAGARCADGYARWLPPKDGFYVPYHNVKVVYHISAEKCRELCWANRRCESADYRAQDVNTLDGSCFLNNIGVEAAVYKSDDEHLLVYECCDKAPAEETTTPSTPTTSPNVVISSWYSSGEGWLSSYYYHSTVTSTFEMVWASSYLDSATSVDISGYSTGEPPHITSLYDISWLSTSGKDGWHSSGVTTWNN